MVARHRLLGLLGQGAMVCHWG